MSNIVIVGLGYVGLTTGLGLAKIGHRVHGVDNNAERVSKINSGELPIYEPGLESELVNSQKSGNFLASTSLKDSSKDSKFFFVCVPTPQDAHGSADMSYVLSAVQEISQNAKPGSIVVIKSTVPVGTGQKVASLVSREDISFASNPEFLREGSALKDFMEPDRIVVGSESSEIANDVLGLYKKIDAPKISTSTKSAEMIKYAANAYLASRLSFVNDLAALCEKVGADIVDVVGGIGSDSRIGHSFLKPGPGWGGSCFPKDTRALISIANENEVPLGLVSASIKSNEQAFERVVERLKDAIGGDLGRKTIAVWGLTFKANTDDIRHSPSLEVIERLILQGSQIVAFDPVGIAPPMEGLKQAYSALECVVGADALLVMTEWHDFSLEDPKEVASKMKGSTVFDTRRILPASSWQASFESFSVIGSGSL